MFLNKLVRKSIFGYLFVLASLFSCKKEKNANTPSNSKITISEAKHFFNSEVLPNSPMTLEAERKRLSLVKIADFAKENDLLFKKLNWEKSYYKINGNDTSMAVPIHFDVVSFLKTGENVGVNFNKLNYLLFKKTISGHITADWITLYPDIEWINGNRDKYLGKVIVADWDGNIKSTFTYEKSGSIQEKKARNKQMVQVESFLLNTTDKLNYKPLLPLNGVEIRSSVSNGGKMMVGGTRYMDKDGNCWENIRETPATEGAGVVLQRKSVSCDDPVEPIKPPGGNLPPMGSGGAIGGSSGSSGGGGGSGPEGCNSTPGYTVPVSAPPSGTVWQQPCSQITIEKIELKPVEAIINVNNAVLCGSYANVLTGNGYTGQVNNLGFTMERRVTGEISTPFVVTIGSGCYTVPAYQTNSYGASEVFKTAYNLAVEEVLGAVKYGIVPADPVSVRTALSLAVNTNLKFYNLGASFSTGPCSGAVPQTTATYNCN